MRRCFFLLLVTRFAAIWAFFQGAVPDIPANADSKEGNGTWFQGPEAPRKNRREEIAELQAAIQAAEAAGRIRHVPAGSAEHRRLQTGSDMPPVKVVITNGGPIVETWKVYDVQFLFGQCYEQRVIDGVPDNRPYSSGVRPENPNDVPSLALDLIDETLWTSQCFGGCKPEEAYIGLDITGTPQWSNAYTDPEKDYEKVRVRCLRYYQSSDFRYMTERLTLQEVHFIHPDLVHVTLDTFEDAAGGRWSRRPAYRGTLWRVSMLSVTRAFWRVSGMEFFQDEACTEMVGPKGSWAEGGPTSSRSLDMEFKSKVNVFDDDPDTFWEATCEYPLPNTSRKGCGPREAWIGMDFGDTPVTIRCFRIYQTPQLPGAIITTATHTHGFTLDYWDGGKYGELDKYWDWGYRHFIPKREEPTLMAPFLGVPRTGYSIGKWEDVRGPDGTSVKISNDEYTVTDWRVHELDFYERVDCEGPRTVGRSISMHGSAKAAEKLADVVFDGDTAPEKWWESNCIAFAGNSSLSRPGACDRQEAWIGLAFRPELGKILPDIKCLRLLQTRTQIFQSPSVNLWTWKNGDWNLAANHRDLGGGWWNRRPAAPYSMWRVVNEEPIQEQWRILEIRAFRDPYCINETTPGVAISSGSWRYRDHFRNAFDGSTMTGWGADCQFCNETQMYWIGQQMPYGSGDELSGLNVVRCLRIWQSENSAEQVRVVRFDVWSGGDWVASPVTPHGIVGIAGGGAWIRQPASAYTIWRLRPTMTTRTKWRLNEVKFYADPECQHRLRLPDTTGGASITVAGYSPEMNGATMGEYWSEGLLAVDGDRDSSYVMPHEPETLLPAWFALDLLSEPTWVRCVRLQQGPLAPEQAENVFLETWNGSSFTNYEHDSDPERHKREVTLNSLGGGGWQRRPARADTIWRIVNLEHISEGWVVKELELHTDPLCGEGANWTGLAAYHGKDAAISSGFIPSAVQPKSKYGPHKAFDGDLESFWLSQCHTIPEALKPIGVYVPPPGCKPRSAWLGLDLGTRPQKVKCWKLLQVGYEAMQSKAVALSRWNGLDYEDVEEFHGLGGSVWHQRPAAANTMWRVAFKTPKENKCRGALQRSYARVWGVAELELYSDEECSSRLVGGVPIVSGTVELHRKTMMDKIDYSSKNAFDGDDNTVWAANCKLGWNSYNQTRVNCKREWLGLSFGQTAIEVRCMRIQQSRLESGNCCDPAVDLRLERWNGTAWLEATWRHEPPPAAPEDYRYLGAHFTYLGKCPPDSSTEPIHVAKVWEMRMRKHSDNCIIPLTGATTLLGKEYCNEHPMCRHAVGPAGACCPVGDGSTSESRCCCEYLSQESIYVDEGESNPYRRDFKVELAVIVLADTLPYFGGTISSFLYIAAQILEPDSQDKVGAWVNKKTLKWHWTYYFRAAVALLLWPFLAWRSLLAEGDNLFVKAIVWFCLPGPERTRPRMLQTLRIVPWVVICAWLGGAFPWIAMGWLMGEFCLKVLIFLSLPIRLAVSRFQPLDDPRQMELRAATSRTRIDQEDDTATGQELLYGAVGTVILTLILFLKFVFDVLILRSHMISYDLIEIIESDRIVDIFPGIVQLLKEPAMLIFRMLSWGSQLMSACIAFLMGIPKCEGSCILIASCALVMVLTTVAQWLNYDLFGLFAGARQSVKKTRPECQRILCDGLVMASMSLQFGAIQCAMLLFTRALKLASPFKSMTWMCEYDDLFAWIIGRVFITVASAFGTAFVFLSCNGHFMGQDYLTRDVASKIGIDLTSLDPDGIGVHGGWIRWNVGFSAVPTVFGMWTDSWNVRGYLIKERCEVYSEEMHDPQPCKLCGQTHVKYQNIMTATGRQLSLAVQILPFGSVLGKGCEYFNDPPLMYFGTKLECIRPVSTVLRAKRPEIPSKDTVTRVLMNFAMVLLVLSDFILPTTRRLASLAIFGMVLVATFGITEENLIERGAGTIQYAFLFAFIKALCELVMENAIGYTLGMIHKHLAQIEEKKVDFGWGVRTVMGQTLAGASVGPVLSIVFIDSGTASNTTGIILGGALAILYSFITLVVNILVELRPRQENDSPADPPLPTIVKTLVCLISGAFFSSITWQVTDFRVAMGVGIIVASVQICVFKVFLIGRRPQPVRDDPTCTDEGRWKASPSIIVLKTQKALPGIVSIPVAALCSALVVDGLGSSFARLVVAMPVGLASGVAVSLALLRFQQQTPQLVGFFSGVFVWFMMMFWNQMVAISLGAFTYAIVGSILEERENYVKIAVVKARWREEDKRRQARRDKKKSMNPEELALRRGSRLSVSSAESLRPLTRSEKMALAFKRVEQGLEIYPGADPVPPLKVEDDLGAYRERANTPPKTLAIECETSDLAQSRKSVLGRSQKSAFDQSQTSALRATAGLNKDVAAVNPVWFSNVEDVIPDLNDRRKKQRPRPLETPQSTLGASVMLALFSDSDSSTCQNSHQNSHGTGGLVDNFRLERDDEDEPPPLPLEDTASLAAKPNPAQVGWDDAGEAPPDSAMYGRWDAGVPKSSQYVKRRARAAPVKASVHSAVQHAPRGKMDTGRAPHPASSRPRTPTGASIGGQSRGSPVSRSGSSPGCSMRHAGQRSTTGRSSPSRR